jgi:putative transposase
MSQKGDYWDNTVAESFFKTIKHEWLNRFKFKSYFQLYNSINEYNTKILYSSLGYLTPLEMELKLNGVTKKAA